jgi:outer membrane immunogenic protein
MALSLHRWSLLVVPAVLSLTATTAFAEPAISPGAYVGIFAGYNKIDAVARDYDPANEQSYSGRGGLAGLQAGYDWNAGALVFGVAADASFTSARGSLLLTGPVIFKVDQQWEGALRGRLGYVVSGALLYATGGGAYAQFETKYSQLGLPFFVTDTDRWGWTAGVGIELPVTDRLGLAAEYRYSDYGKDGSSVTTPDGPYTLTNDRLTMGLNYRF